MKFTIKETGKPVSLAVIMTYDGHDWLQEAEEILEPGRFDHDNLRDLPVRKGRIVISEAEFLSICQYAEGFLGDQGDSYISYRGFVFPRDSNETLKYTDSKRVHTRWGF